MNPDTAGDLAVVPGVLAAFKMARIVTRPSGFAFEGIGWGGAYGVHDLAVCVRDSSHVPPVLTCGCGFYALRKRDRAVGMVNHVGIALLDVDMWGRFEAFEHGYIAAVQQVRRVTLVPFCIPCLYRRDHEVRQAAALSLGPAPGREFVPVCGEHLTDDRQVVTARELAEAFSLDVAWAGEDDELAQVAGKIVASFYPPRVRSLRGLDDLLPDETAFVFANAVAIDDRGWLWLDPLARLTPPLPGIDVAVRLAEDGVIEVDPTGVDLPGGWQRRDDPARHALPAREAKHH